VDHVPVHVGARDLKQRLYEAVMPKWRAWAHDYPLLLDDFVMRDHHWVILLPKNPDRNIIAAQFFKPKKKGTPVFRSGKCVINLHIPNDIYQGMLNRKDAEDAEAESDDVDTMVMVDFTVGFSHGTMIFYKLKYISVS
jgi:hypothetical protein